MLNSWYKIKAAILQRRIERGVDRFLQKTQYGFRRVRSTSDAIFLIRRILEHAEATQDRILLLLLDWEKAFDKVRHEALFITLQRMGVPEHLSELVKSLYSKPMFSVTLDGHTSNQYEQKTGIRQGCPLSPYLFLLVMTAMFHDIHAEDAGSMCYHRPTSANYDEVVYADDTICVSKDTKTLNRHLARIEKHGRRYGLKLNKGKCELITNVENADVKFTDGTKVTRKDEATYLGCCLNSKSDVSKEVNKRIGICMAF